MLSPTRRFVLLLFAVTALACEPDGPDGDPGPALDPEGSLFGPGALGNPSMLPIGGGEGYGDWPRPGGAVVQENEGADVLRGLLADALPGDVVHVAPGARIDLGNQRDLVIPPGVTLSGARGQAGALGALLFTDDRQTSSKTPFITLSPDARLTGFRIQGPSLAWDWFGCGSQQSRAVGITGSGTGADLNVRVDNNEIYGWTVAVSVLQASGVRIDHNHIHHNQRRQDAAENCRKPDGSIEAWSLGYGVSVSTGTDPGDGSPMSAHASIDANLFHHNRHDIASDGGRGAAYTARYNIVHDARLSHSFDVHEGKEIVGSESASSTIAGDWFEVHHNTFLQSAFAAVKIRAHPERGAFVHHNQFAHSREATDAYGGGAVHQQVDSELDPATGRYGRDVIPIQIDVHDNQTGVGGASAWLMAPGGASAPLNRGDEWDWILMQPISLGGEGAPDDREPGFWTLRRFDDTPIYEVAFGDFDCDGRQDAFRTTGTAWEYSPDARGDWVALNASSIGLHNLRLGDFDGDGCTDVFRAKPSATSWYVSWGGRAGWTALNASSADLPHLAFGDFDGDGTTDVLKANGSSWRISWGGSSPWTYVRASSILVDDLAFGDFDGDGTTDAFYANGSRWYVSWGASSTWETINSSAVQLADLGFGDFDGDGTTDVLRRRSSSGKWEISWSGRSGWEMTRTSSLAPAALGFADLNGDGATDILSLQTLD